MAQAPIPQVPPTSAHDPAGGEAVAQTPPTVAGGIVGRLVGRITAWRRSLRLLVVLELAFLYTVAFVPLHAWLGMANSLLSIAPVAAAAGLLGLAAGLRAALGLSVLTAALYGFVGHWDEALRSAAPMLFVLVVVGLVIGACHDLLVHLVQRQRRAEVEIAEREAEIAERQLSEAGLRARERHQASVAELGRRALAGADLGDLVEDAIAAVQQTLAVQHCAVWQLTDQQGALRVGGSTPDDLVRPHMEQTLKSGRPTIVGPPVSGVMVPIQGRDGPFGVLGAHTVDARTFTPEDVGFLQTVANVLGTAIQRAWAEQELSREAKHDPLTGLPNRALFRERLGSALAAPTETDSAVAVLYLDLDNFKWVNDTLGHSAGDEVLLAVADALRGVLRPGDTASRLGGDEFSLLLRHPAHQSTAEEVAQQILSRLGQPRLIADQKVAITPSVGIALCAPGAEPIEPDELLRQADTAMYQAKLAGKGCFVVFDPTTHSTTSSNPERRVVEASRAGTRGHRKPATRRSPRKSSPQAS